MVYHIIQTLITNLYTENVWYFKVILMKTCSFCKKENKRKDQKYCKICHNLYVEMQKDIFPYFKSVDTNLIHKRKFRFCNNCHKKLALPRKHSCNNCYILLTMDYFFKIYMRSLTYIFLRRGYIKKSKFCELCRETKTEGHHEDYNKPAKINWLCKLHHVQHHLSLRA